MTESRRQAIVRKVRVKALLICLAGITLFIAAAFILIKNRRIVHESIVARATVVSMSKINDNNRTQYRTRVQFQHFSGDLVTAMLPPVFEQPTYQIGHRLDISYNPYNPLQAQEYSVHSEWLFGLLLSVLSVLSLGIGMGMMFHPRLKEGKPVKRKKSAARQIPPKHYGSHKWQMSLQNNK